MNAKKSAHSVISKFTSQFAREIHNDEGHIIKSTQKIRGFVYACQKIAIAIAIRNHDEKTKLVVGRIFLKKLIFNILMEEFT